MEGCRMWVRCWAWSHQSIWPLAVAWICNVQIAANMSTIHALCSRTSFVLVKLSLVIHTQMLYYGACGRVDRTLDSRSKGSWVWFPLLFVFQGKLVIPCYLCPPSSKPDSTKACAEFSPEEMSVKNCSNTSGFLTQATEVCICTINVYMDI